MKTVGLRLYDEIHADLISLYREPLDLLLGILHKDGDFLMYHFDSRRFQPYHEEDE